jgi:hypothetical protein
MVKPMQRGVEEVYSLMVHNKSARAPIVLANYTIFIDLFAESLETNQFDALADVCTHKSFISAV